jgi:hypothetical protein
MSRDPTFGSSGIRRQFSELADLLEEETTVYLIGGGALTLQGLKNATRDIDLIVREESDIEQLHRVLRSAGYERSDNLSEEYAALGAAFILEKNGRRFDVFHEQVAGVIRLSDAMVSRSEHLIEENKLTVRAVSLNDIFLFKAVANREDDVEDMIRLAEAGIDDSVILDEIETQLEFLGRDEFIGAIDKKLDRLRQRGFRLAIHEEIQALNARVQDAVAVKNAIDSLQVIEYADDLYEGVPKSAIERQLDEETVDSGLSWLSRLGRIERADDDSIVLRD